MDALLERTKEAIRAYLESDEKPLVSENIFSTNLLARTLSASFRNFSVCDEYYNPSYFLLHIN